jgi:hypothetical protein
MLPGKAAKQNRDLIPFLGRKRPLYGTVKMCGLVQTSDLAEPGALGLQALLDFFIVVNLYKIGRHYLPPAYAVFWGFGERTRTRDEVVRVVVAESGEADVGEAAKGHRAVPALG